MQQTFLDFLEILKLRFAVPRRADCGRSCEPRETEDEKVTENWIREAYLGLCDSTATAKKAMQLRT
jgi:hypothetical protein